MIAVLTRQVKLLGLLLALGMALAAPQAEAAPQPSGVAAAGYGLALPLANVPSLQTVPPGFSTDGAQAVQSAEATPALQALHQTHRPLQYVVQVWAGTRWEVDFYFKRKILAEVDVSSAGRVTGVWTGPLAIDYAGRGHFGGLFDSPWVVLPFGLLFLLPFVDLRRPLRLRHLDLLVLLSFGVSYWLYNHAHFEPAVLLVYPPLLYLLARMLAIGLRGRVRKRSGPDASEPTRLPLIALGLGLLALVGARIGLDLATHKVIDVGYASVIGAHRITHDMSLYYASAAHGDTYGSIAYLAYVPFELLWPWQGSWDYLPAAHAAAITFDVLTIVGLVVLGMRLRTGAAGRRLGLSLGWAWAAFPFTLFGLMNNTNDGLVAMLLVFSLIAVTSPVGRGTLLGLAAAAKFFPLALLGLYARGSAPIADRRRTVREMLVCCFAFAAVVVLAIGLYLPAGGVSEVWNHTIGFQLHRGDVYSLWGLHPSLDWLKTICQAGAIGLAAMVLFVRRDRDRSQFAALAAAIIIAVQLPAVHWFYFYIVWFAPFVFVALLARERAPATIPPAEDTAAKRLPELVAGAV